MELKVFNKIEQAPEIEQFQSHLYGIESVNKQIAIFDLAKFQSHLYGIESDILRFAARSLGVSIAPLWN